MSCDEKNFSKNYFVLKPDNASFYDLGCFLFSSESKDCEFIECSSEDLKGGFWRRWYIFSSLFAQKLLLKVENPMKKLGKVLEQWLNLLSSNGGLLRLFTNFLTGLVCVCVFFFFFFWGDWFVLYVAWYIEHLIGYKVPYI